MRNKIRYALICSGLLFMVVSLILMCISGSLIYNVADQEGVVSVSEENYFSVLLLGHDFFPFLAALSLIIWLFMYSGYMVACSIYLNKKPPKDLTVVFAWLLSINAFFTCSLASWALRNTALTSYAAVATAMVFAAAAIQTAAFLITTERAKVQAQRLDFRPKSLLRYASLACILVAVILMAIPGSVYYSLYDSVIETSFFWGFPFGLGEYQMYNMTVLFCLGWLVSLALPLYLRKNNVFAAIIFAVLAVLSSILSLVIMPQLSAISAIIMVLLLLGALLLFMEIYFHKLQKVKTIS